MIKSLAKYIFVVCMLALTFTNCGKSGDGHTPTPPITPPPPTLPPVTPSNASCVLSGISQVNSGSKPEFALTEIYDNNSNVKSISVHDSTTNETTFHTNFNYITSDSITIGQDQYIRLDGTKRVVILSIKSNLSDPFKADDYMFKYTYDMQGYLVKKDLYINGSGLPNFSTTYNYTNNLLTSCVMTTRTSGNSKVLETTLSYDNLINVKNWIYTFPDATIENKYNIALNFGNRPVNPIKTVSTKIYHPVTGALLDTWSTAYGGYKQDTNGNIIYGEATGDLQQGIAVFYGKTNFYYTCH